MKAFTIASGDHAQLAAITVPCFEWATGLSVTVLDRVPDAGLGPSNPHAAKLTLPDGEQYVFFDADLLLRRHVRFDVPEESFGAVRLQLQERGLRTMAEKHQLRGPLYSTGLFVASSAHRAVMGDALALWKANPGDSVAHEESWLNLALQRSATPITDLPRDWNQQLITNARGVGLHFCRESGVPAKLRALRFNLTNHAPRELLAHLDSVGAFRARKSVAVPLPAAVGSSDLTDRRHSRIAKGVGAHGASRQVGVLQSPGVTELVGQDVDQ